MIKTCCGPTQFAICIYLDRFKLKSRSCGMFQAIWPTRIALFLLAVLLFSGCKESSSYPSDDKLPRIPWDIKRTELGLRTLGASARKDTAHNKLTSYNTHIDTAFYADWLPVDGEQFTRADVASDVVRFATDSSTQTLIDSVLLLYPADDDLTKLLERPLQRIKSRWDTVPIPAIRTYINGYIEPGQPTMDPGYLSERYLAIGLHYFLGTSLPYYPRDIPRYYRRRFQPAYMPVYVADLFRTYHGLQARPPRGKRLTLAERAVYEGIRMEYLAEICQETPDSVRFAYSPEQMKWVEQYQPVIYQRMLPQLFSSDAFAYNKLVEEGPTTAGLPPEAPGRIAHYFGWQVVRAWRAKHPDVTLAQLLQRTDYGTIFQQSGYKP